MKSVLDRWLYKLSSSVASQSRSAGKPLKQFEVTNTQSFACHLHLLLHDIVSTIIKLKEKLLLCVQGRAIPIPDRGRKGHST